MFNMYVVLLFASMSCCCLLVCRAAVANFFNHIIFESTHKYYMRVRVHALQEAVSCLHS